MKRMAVPAAMMSITSGVFSKAAITTEVSSQSERLPGRMLPPERAWMTSARLLMLFDAGRFIVARNDFGAMILYVIDKGIKRF